MLRRRIFPQASFRWDTCLKELSPHLFKNRFLPDEVDQTSFLERSKATKIIVIADGDLARNDINPRTGQPQQLGYDQFSRYTFANQELLLNAVTYLVSEEGLIGARNKELKIRPLDKEKIRAEKINLASNQYRVAAGANCSLWSYAIDDSEKEICVFLICRRNET
jgi:hypothetical protein